MAFVSVSFAMPEGAGWLLVGDSTTSNVAQFSVAAQNAKLILNGTELYSGGTITKATFILNNWTQFTISNLAANGMTVLQATQQADLREVLALLLAGNDWLVGSFSNDTLRGFGGNDTLDGSYGADSMFGGPGNDTYRVDDANDQVVEAAGRAGGNDVVRTSVSGYALAAGVERLVLVEGAFYAYGNAGASVVTLNSDGGRFEARAGADTVHGGAGSDDIFGEEGADRLKGGGARDWLSGGAGNDTLLGGAEVDELTGGAGKDVLVGGAGSDSFWYKQAPDSGPDARTRDIIEDFDVGLRDYPNDVIDLSGLAPPLRQFEFKGSGSFDADASYQVRYEYHARRDEAVVLISLDRDADAEMSIALSGVRTLEAYHFS